MHVCIYLSVSDTFGDQCSLYFFVFLMQIPMKEIIIGLRAINLAFPVNPLFFFFLHLMKIM